MAHFKRKGKGGTPAISTASLPDIVFMLLFFFMVSTTMRERDIQVKITMPDASEVSKLEKKSVVSYIYVGKPKKDRYGDKPRVQLNDVIATNRNLEGQVQSFIQDEKSSMSPADRKAMMISLKVDKELKMGLVQDIKQELRRNEAFKINYSAKETDRRK